MTIQNVHSDLQELNIETTEISSLDHFNVIDTESLIFTLNDTDTFLKAHVQISSDMVFGFNVCTKSEKKNILRSYIWPKDVTDDMYNELQYDGDTLASLSMKANTVTTEFDLCEWPLILQIIRKMLS